MRSKLKAAVFVCMLLITVNESYGQVVQKGQVLAGLNINTTGEQSTYFGPTNSFSWLRSSSLEAEAGYAIKNNLIAGIRLGTGITPQGIFYRQGSSIYSEHNNNRFISAGIFLRQYVPLGKKVSLFAEGALSFKSGRNRFGNTDYNGDFYTGVDRYRDLTLGFGMGVMWSVSKRVKIDITFNNLASMGFQSNRTSYTYFTTGQQYKYTERLLNLDPVNGFRNANISIGIKLALGRQ